MISDAEVRLAEWILQQSCRERKICGGCPHGKSCPLCDNHKCPDDWDIPASPSEPTERPRIEWLRMLPDMEMLNVMDYSHFSLECADCYNSDSDGECLRKSDVEYCDVGHMEWWREVVTLEQFRKDVGLE